MEDADASDENSCMQPSLMKLFFNFNSNLDIVMEFSVDLLKGVINSNSCNLSCHGQNTGFPLRIQLIQSSSRSWLFFISIQACTLFLSLALIFSNEFLTLTIALYPFTVEARLFLLGIQLIKCLSRSCPDLFNNTTAL